MFNTKVEIFIEDTLKERKCKDIYNKNNFNVFQNNYQKFREYSIKMGAYDTKEYTKECFDYWFIKTNYPEFISEL